MKFTCYRCFYNVDKKSSFINHLNKKIVCKKVQESYKYSDEEVLELNNSQINNTKDINHECNICNKIFTKKHNLTKHLLVHKDKEINNVNINIINNINIHYPIPFDKDWDLSKIDELNIYKLLFSNFMYSKLLEEILKNEINLNVIIENEKNSDFGLVYKNDSDKYVNMKINDILESSMNKLNKHLLTLNNNLDPNIMNNHILTIKELINKKFDEYNKNNITHENVDKIIIDRYSKVHQDAVKICNKINNLELNEY
jgi:hypothetical protein